MTSFAAAPLWIPEDDFILKNALEAGASLESLSKGAVRFSRTYSFTQLRDRWRSILYDADDSTKAADSMLDLELSKYAGAIDGAGGNGAGGAKGKTKTTVRKRKIQSLRKQYYARKRMRKIIRREVLDSLDIGFDEVRIVDNAVRYDGNETGGNLDKDMNNLIVNSFVGNGSHSGLGEAGVGPSNSTSEVPLWKTMEDVSAPALPVQVSGNGVLNAPGGAVLGEGGTRISDSLMDGLRLDGAATATENPGYDNVVSAKVGSLLLSAPCDIVQGNDACVVPESRDTRTKLAVRRGSSAAEPEVVAVANPLGESQGDMHLVPDPGNEVQPLVAAAQSPPREGSEDLPTCTLNTEDTDIPLYDNENASAVVPRLVAVKPQPVANGRVNVSVVASPSVALKFESIAKEVGYSDSSINNQRKNEAGGSSKKEEIRSNSFAAPLTVQSGLVSNRKAEGHVASKKLEGKSLLRSQEGCDDNDNDNDNDDDNSDEEEIPYFDDAEQMILEMELCPVDEDINPSREVLEYQHGETKRTIMRLEQGAGSFTQRAIASEGALAVLYGHNMRQYIKKSEVILGRATADMQVDIDLGREGRANKISRRQALIKMVANGSFIIKNLGQRSIFLNGKEVCHGQLRRLSASCIIEISGLAFVFEFNSKAVRRVSENAAPKGES